MIAFLNITLSVLIVLTLLSFVAKPLLLFVFDKKQEKVNDSLQEEELLKKKEKAVKVVKYISYSLAVLSLLFLVINVGVMVTP